jgi:hypothetical protein
MHRRTFLTASVLATTAAITHEKGALARDARPVASEGPIGATAAALPLPASEQLPLGPLAATRSNATAARGGAARKLKSDDAN